MTVPAAEPFPPELRGRPALALAMVHAGTVEEAEAAVRPLRAHGRPALDLLRPMTLDQVQTMLDESAPHGMRNHSRAHWLRELPGAAIDELVERHADVPSQM